MNLADVYVTILPESSRVGEAIRRAYRDAEREARASGRAQRREVETELGKAKITVKVGANTQSARREIDGLKPHSQRVGEAMGSLIGHSLGMGVAAQIKTLKIAPLAGVAGLGLAGVGGGLASIIGVAARTSGALALIPAAAEGAALAMGALKLGASGVGDALGNMGDPTRFAKALGELSPNARQAALSVAALKPQFDQLKNSAQDALFAGLGQQITQLSRTYLPIVSQGFTGINQAANQAATSVMEWAKSGEAVSLFSQLMGNTNTGMRILAQAAQPAAQAVLTLGAAGSDSLPRLSQAVADVSDRFAGFITNAAETGRIGEWIDTGLTSITQLGHAIGAVGSVFATVFKAGSDTGGGMLGAITQAAGAFNDFLKSAEGQESLQGFFTGISQAASALAPILGTVAQIVGTTIVPALANLGTGIAPALNSLLQGLGTGLGALGPVFEQLAGPLSQLGELLGGVLAQVIPALAPGLAPLAQAFVSLASAVAPILPPIAKLIGDLVSALAPALSTVLGALAPVVSQLMEALKPVLDALGPVLGQVAQQIAGVLAQAITELLPPLMPLVKNIAELLATLLPVIPAVVQVAAAIAGALIKAISLVLPLVARLLGDFVRLSNGLAQVVVPAIKFVADGFKGLWDGVKWVLDKIGQGLDWIGNKIGSVPYLGDALKNIGVLPGHAEGGLITGPGSATSDSIVARLSNGEYVMPAAQTSRNLPLLKALHAGQSPERMRAMFPGFAQGGLVGDGSKNRYVDAIVAEGLRRGLSEHEIQTALMTVGVETNFQNYANQSVPDSMRIAHDAVGSDHDSVGLFQQRNSWGSAAARMDPTASAGLFYDQLVKVRGYQTMDTGRLAQAVQRSAFPDRYAQHEGEAAGLLRASMARIGGVGQLADGASAAPFGPDATGDRRTQSAERSVRDAQQSVEDHQWRADRAKRRALEAKTAKQREDAEHSLMVAERELADSHERLKDAQDRRAEAVAKADEKQQKQSWRSSSAQGGSKGPGGEDFGHSLVSGALSAVGLDGSVLSNPFEWSGVKWLTSMINGFAKPAQSGEPQGQGVPGGWGPPASDPAQLSALGQFSPAVPSNWASPDGPGGVSNTYDQRIDITGQFGGGPDEMARVMRDEMGNRNRGFAMNAGRM